MQSLHARITSAACVSTRVIARAPTMGASSHVKRHKGSCKPYYQAGLEHALIGLPAAEHAKELLTQESNFYQQFSTALKIPLMKRNHCDFLN